MWEWFVVYGQWGVLVTSVLGIYFMSNQDARSLKKGFLFNGISRAFGSVIFAFTDLYAMLIMNFIHVILSIRGYFGKAKDD